LALVFHHVETTRRWLAAASIATPLIFQIKREWKGHRLYVAKNGKGIIAHLLDNFNEAKNYALRYYGLPLNEWKRAGFLKWSAQTLRSPVQCEILEDFFRTRTGEEAYYYMLNVIEDGYGLFDYHQDSLEVAMEQAQDEFHVPLEAWQEMKGGEIKNRL